MVNVAMNGHRQFGNPRVRTRSDWSRDEERPQKVRPSLGQEELLRFPKAPNTDMEAGKHIERDVWETPWIRVSQPWGAVLCTLGNLAMALTFTH